MGFAGKADFVQRVVDRPPLHEVVRIDLMGVQASPDVGSRKGCFDPVVTLTLHLLAVVVFPVSPLDGWVIANKRLQNDD